MTHVDRSTTVPARRVPAAPPAVADLLELWCPDCGAGVGHDCEGDEPHLARVEAADGTPSAAPAPRAGAGRSAAAA